MALVFGTGQHQGPAKTHVLLIGVGRYKHLLGGSAPTPNLPPLGQLTSPPISARELTNWFTAGNLVNKAAPLGSVELLLSDSAGQQFAGTPIEDATTENIRTAFEAWYDRCDAHEGNVAIFYFCGHGLQKDCMVLLPEDFGQSKLNPWATAIDFDRTYRGMAQCHASTHLYIVDACRQLSQIATLDLDASGQPLKTAVLNRLRPRTAPRLFATANGLPAFGDTGKVSRLTGALIECLNGGAAIQQGGKWIVDTDHLGGAVQRLIQHRNESLPENEQQFVDPAGGDNVKGPQRLLVLRPNIVPQVIVKLCCDPDAMTPNATFHATLPTGQTHTAKGSGRWCFNLPAGVCEFGCMINGAAAPNRVVEFVQPPVWPITLEV